MLANAMITPLPHASPLQSRVPVHCLPIFGKTTRAIAHSMGVFAQEMRFPKVGSLSQFHEILNWRVNRAKDIGDFRFSIGVVVNESGWIVCTNPGRHRLVIAAKK